MKRGRKGMPRKKRRGGGENASLGKLLTFFLLAILINAGLMTSSSYMLLLRTGVMQPLMRFALWPLLLVLLCILFAVLLAAGFGGRQLRPIHRVNDAMKKVSQGDFSIRLSEEDSVGEIRELITSYNHMAEELSSIELFRTDFINNFSHEFKTPIVSIRGFAKQLERDDLTDEQRREYTSIIVSESERLANMASNILLLTKLENQQIVTDREEYRLDEQLRKCILLLEKNWSAKEIELSLNMDEVTYVGNEEMMSHVWVNLIGNAVKFSPQGGLLEITCARMGNGVIATIRDHGEGMDEDTQKRIFEKFYQGDSAHATEGNGLGLSLVKRIVDLCNGQVVVDSHPGAGTAFTVTLPDLPKAA